MHHRAGAKIQKKMKLFYCLLNFSPNAIGTITLDFKSNQLQADFIQF